MAVRVIWVLGKISPKGFIRTVPVWFYSLVAAVRAVLGRWNRYGTDAAPAQGQGQGQGQVLGRTLPT
jgi:hypothetical protein